MTPQTLINVTLMIQQHRDDPGGGAVALSVHTTVSPTPKGQESLGLVLTLSTPSTASDPPMSEYHFDR